MLQEQEPAQSFTELFHLKVLDLLLKPPEVLRVQNGQGVGGSRVRNTGGHLIGQLLDHLTGNRSGHVTPGAPFSPEMFKKS